MPLVGMLRVYSPLALITAISGLAAQEYYAPKWLDSAGISLADVSSLNLVPPDLAR